MARLTPEERALLRSVERGEWHTAPKSTVKRYLKAARETMKKARRVNIRLSEADLDRIRAIAIEEGLPYQTLISSVLHKYVTGTLISKR